jgi:WD40 repeat protein
LFFFHTGPVYGLAADVSSSQRLFATVGDDKKLMVWDSKDRVVIGKATLKNPSRCCHLDKTNSFLAVGSNAGSLTIYFLTDFMEKGGNYYYFRYLWEVLTRANYTVVMKDNPATPDESVTVESLIKSMVIYGSSKTVTEKLLAFRQRVGPFGTLLMSSMDGSGENRHREWETMRRLATEVLPVFRQAI